MRPLYKGLTVAVLQLLIVGSLGAKLLYDRSHRPRAWIKTATIDPDLPIRGRYLILVLEVRGECFLVDERSVLDGSGGQRLHPHLDPTRANLEWRNGELVALASLSGTHWVVRGSDDQHVVVNTNTAFFIPEHLQDPSRRSPGEELWVEATIPRAGPPRPIRLGVKKDGQITPLDIR